MIYEDERSVDEIVDDIIGQPQQQIQRQWDALTEDEEKAKVDRTPIMPGAPKKKKPKIIPSDKPAEQTVTGMEHDKADMILNLYEDLRIAAKVMGVRPMSVIYAMYELENTLTHVGLSDEKAQ